jgi:hypothetical protein
MPRKSPYPPEVRERAVKLFVEHQDEYLSEWAAMTGISAKMGTAKTLRSWVAGPRSTRASCPRDDVAHPPLRGPAMDSVVPITEPRSPSA